MKTTFAKKSLGQHFLASSAYARAMADAGGVSAPDEVLEIGPGRGALTKELLARGATVTAVEKDDALPCELAEKFQSAIQENKLVVLHEDALSFDARKHFGARPFKIVSNIPYYLTGALFEKFLAEAPRPTVLVFLVQKEVALRIAREKKESILSLSVKAFGTPRLIKTVPRGAFSPAPKVDSAILKVSGISAENFSSAAHEKRFFEILHAGFAHKRKLLARNLESAFQKEELAGRFARAHILPNARAEDVSLNQWLSLASHEPSAIREMSRPSA